MQDLALCELTHLREDGEFVIARAQDPGSLQSWLVVTPAREQPAASSLARLEHAFALRGELDVAWATQPADLVILGGRTALVMNNPGGQFLDELMVAPLPVPHFLRLAISLANALGSLHARGLVHKDVKPASFIVSTESGGAWLTGFGLASRFPRHRQAPDPPEIIAGTLAYMAPEQTGRMNRTVDSRSDLYSLGVTLYEMLTGSLPFTACDPMEWVHCHTARHPPTPRERLESVPAAVSAIIMKLLAKTAENRYQSAAGAESDLRRCLSEWQTQGHISDFALGERDNLDRLLIPEKLYGREHEVGTLLSAFDRIVAGGRLELVLVSGYSGVGKSAVVNELHKPLTPPRGLFASGKFDQYKRDIPYATLAQAFQSLIRPLLSKSEQELSKFRAALCDAVATNGALVVELIPELVHIIGEQPAVPELPPRDAQARIHLVLRRFIQVFARAEHPLALFLDDLQWLDAATLDLLEELLSQNDLRHLLLIAAYRDNEVHSTHPLMRKLAAMREAGAIMHDIVLAPLGREELGQLLADSLRCDSAHAAPLARLIHDKTSGNPFFAIQFITTLAEEGLLTFDYAAAHWTWDLKQIHNKGYTDNVVELMIGKLSRLPVATQNALQQFACLGNRSEFRILQMVHPSGNGALHEHLWEAVRAGLVFPSETFYSFLHDRVQEAAYSMIPVELRAQAHLRIGRLLAQHTPPAHRDEVIFEIVNQLNRGLQLVTSAQEREQVANLNLVAAKRAKLSTAYASALKYLEAARSLLTEEDWNRNYDLIFSIECLTAECELLTAEMVQAEERLTMLALRAQPRHDFAVVTRLRLTLYTALDRSELAIEVFLDYLRRSGTDWSHHPTRADVLREYDRIWSLIGNRRIEELADLPLLTDPDIFDMLDVFTEIVHPAMFYDENLASLAVCRMVNLSLEHGNCDGSCFGYVWFAMFAGPRFNNYKDGFRFGQLGYDLVERGTFPLYQARTFITFSTLLPWAKHAAEARELVRRAYDVACQTGDLTYSAYSWHVLITNHLTVGDALKVVQGEAEMGLAFATKQGFGLVVANCGAHLGLIRTLRGLTPTFGCFDHDNYTEAEAEAHYASNPALVLSEFFYWTRKLQARYIASDYAAAVAAASRARQILWTARSQVETGDYRFYAALAHAAVWQTATVDEQPQHWAALREHQQQLEIWAEHCPTIFENRIALVNAEIARLTGQTLEAEHLYEKAILSAHVGGFIHNEAIANELAAQFYRSRGFATIADAYLKNARACYEQWGARGKVNQLEARFSQLRAGFAAHVASSTIDTPVIQMDAEAVIKASQTLSSEMNLPSLIEKLLRLAVEYAGAQRGLLILLHADGPYIEAEANSWHDSVEISIRHERVSSTDLPQSTLQFVLRTHERVILNDASSSQSQSEDEYIRHKGPKSVLCLPILKQTKVIGALYLENNLASHAFTPDRAAILDVLASQAAISLENAALLTDLQLQVGLLQHLPVSAWTLKPDGTPDFVNDNWLEFSGQTLDFIRSHPEAWMTAVHPDDREMAAKIFWEGVHSEQGFTMETRSLRAQDGAYRWHLQQAVVLRDSAGKVLKFVGTTTDIDDQKRTEEALRQAQAELAHATRVTTLGELAASIAHEVNQPIAGVVINGNACLRWLSKIQDDSASLKEAREAIQRIIRDGNRTGEIIDRIRKLFKKTDLAKEPLDLNETVREVIALARSEIEKQWIRLRLDLSPDLPNVLGDRVQLQQVLLNLILNAIEAMSTVDHQSRELIIRTQYSEERHEVMATVCDTGIGLSRENSERVFKAFHTTKAGGLGMGLSISRSIVENHDGRLWTTPHDGPGASFCFALPSQPTLSLPARSKHPTRSA
ncbi:trifunctional serine/threonine-protein kinase/ATP-binding protein/sensor histidine kinase [Anatilimnocola floriformis]|uniref:trifunctional serine/threonine-protein kinase/ATP-binding protein/sensor histidine kinase n=1 Tax=Anatilimnocola floriformis TaxID=2948575 RepID=UPI0020C38AB9|nr:AAA family ATPase [Anatilimnocola floriformis]